MARPVCTRGGANAIGDPARKARLANVYRELTGGDVERRLYVLRD